MTAGKNKLRARRGVSGRMGKCHGAKEITQVFRTLRAIAANVYHLQANHSDVLPC
jgi:hypothetical protein